MPWWNFQVGGKDRKENDAVAFVADAGVVDVVVVVVVAVANTATVST